ncbi:hypothetical protein KEM48_005711 [Puccinia striiformis f. sp. tritici PST-130]|nr:hypothetical protein KEM48_005711 [Puccinia striiformis f. sp. tritici PST-130]
MAFTRNMISLLMVSIWVGMVMSATTNNLDASKKAPAGGPTSWQPVWLPTLESSLMVVELPVAKDSISTPIKVRWLTGMCKAPVCDPAALAAAAEKFKTGCAAEMASKSMDAAAFYSLLTTYKTIRDEGCKNTQQLNFCDPTLAGHIQSWTKNERPFFSVPKAAYCMECGKSQPPPPGSKPLLNTPSVAITLAKQPVLPGDKPAGPGKPEKGDKPGGPGKPEKADKPAGSGKSDKPAKTPSTRSSSHGGI